MDSTFLSHLLVPDEGDLKPIVEQTLASIDRVHTVLDLPLLHVCYNNAVIPFGQYVPGDGGPDHIMLSRLGPHKRLSLSHEIGHLLDHALGKYNVYCSEERISLIADTVNVARSSNAIRTLQATSDGTCPVEIGLNRWQIGYWLAPTEIWARAYAQYIALRSNDAIMRQEIGIAQDLQPFAVSRCVQWEAADFETIASAIDAAFRRLGWRT